MLNSIKYFRLRIKGFRAKDAGVYSCQNEEDKFKEMAVTIKHKIGQDQDNLEGNVSQRRQH